MPYAYPPPLDQLIRLGEPQFGHTRWMDYPARFGLGAEHVPDLIRILRDPELQEGAVEVYAAVHAWRALAQLRARAAIPALLDTIRSADPDDDWVTEDLSTVFEHIGEAAFDPLVALFTDRSLTDEVRARAAGGFTDIVRGAPELRGQAVRVLTRALDAYTPESADLHVYIISNLLELQAVESLLSLRRAFEEDRVDTMLMDWEEVEVSLGFKQRRSMPLAPFVRAAGSPLDDARYREDDAWPPGDDFVLPQPSAPAAASRMDRARETVRKKMAKKSRKQNRRK